MKFYETTSRWFHRHLKSPLLALVQVWEIEIESFAWLETLSYPPSNHGSCAAKMGDATGAVFFYRRALLRPTQKVRMPSTKVHDLNGATLSPFTSCVLACSGTKVSCVLAPSLIQRIQYDPIPRQKQTLHSSLLLHCDDS